MPSWVETTLGDLCEIYQPEMLAKKSLPPTGEFPVFGANGQIGWFDRFNHEHSEVVLGCRGSCGSINVTPPRTWITSNAMVVRPRGSTISKALLRYLLMQVDLAAVTTGVAQPQITRTSLAPVTIRYPTHLAEQQRIVAILDEAFAAISGAVACAERNDRNAVHLFETSRRALFSDRSSSWKFEPIAAICENLDGRRRPVTKADRIPGAVPYYGASGVVDHVEAHLFDEDLLLVSEDGANLLARTYPIAFSISGRSWVNNHAHVLRFADKRTQKFVEHYLNSIDLEPYVTGMAQPKLNQAALNKIPVPLPPPDRRAEIVASLEQLHIETQGLAKVLKRKLQAFSELERSLLARAFSGDLTPEPLAP